MASKKKSQPKTEEIIATVETPVVETATEEVVAEVAEVKEERKDEIKTEKPKKVEKITKKEPKHKIGSIVFVSKDAEADLNGFKLFPQYKKYTYTVEAYDADTDVYTLRRLNLTLRLKEGFILAPHERAHDPINRRQF